MMFDDYSSLDNAAFSEGSRALPGPFVALTDEVGQNVGTLLGTTDSKKGHE